MLLTSVLLFWGEREASARTIQVSFPTAVNGKSYTAGDTIVIANGNYSNQTIVFSSNGTASNPIVLMAEDGGKVILTGNSTLSFSGSHLEVSGLRFKNGYSSSGNAVIQFRRSSSNLAENCRLINCSIENYNPSDRMIDYKWISLYGHNHRVENCYFVNKSHIGTLLVVWLASGDKQEANHSLLNNYFGFRNPILDENGSELNGQEIVRIGDSGTSLQLAGCLVENNYFEHTNGEIEIISNKSCGNTYRNNLFYECIGMLTLRHGNGCTIDGNWFFGNGISNTGGIRIIGEKHVVVNNYMYRLGGSGYRSSICLVRGEVENALSGYAQVKEAKVLFNTVYNCKSALEVSYGSGSTQTLSPVSSTIAHNVSVQTGSNNTLKVHKNSPQVEWSNNIFYGGSINSSNKPSSGITTGLDPLFIADTADGYAFYSPSATTSLESKRTSTAYSEVEMDIWGGSRPTKLLPGAMETSAKRSRTIPSALTSGPSWMRTPVKITNHSSKSLKSFLYLSDRQQIVCSKEIKQISIFTPNGQQIGSMVSNQMDSNFSYFDIPMFLKGLYIVTSRLSGLGLGNTIFIH